MNLDREQLGQSDTNSAQTWITVTDLLKTNRYAQASAVVVGFVSYLGLRKAYDVLKRKYHNYPPGYIYILKTVTTSQITCKNTHSTLIPVCGVVFF